MLAFDIETTGLSPNRSKVTVVCTEDYYTGEKKAYEFARWAGEGQEKHDELREQLINDFNAATSLCAFNGVRFDLPFLRTALKIPDPVVASWVLKTTDILEQSRLLYKTTFSLNLLCETNQIPQKTGDGLKAIKMAESGDFDGLKDYCEDDVTILNNLYRQRHITLPKLNQVQDLGEWAHVDMYEPVPTPIPKPAEAKLPASPPTEDFLKEQVASGPNAGILLDNLLELLGSMSQDNWKTLLPVSQHKAKENIQIITRKVKLIKIRYDMEAEELSDILNSMEESAQGSG